MRALVVVESGAPINRVVLSGGLPQKDGVLMQMLADVLNRELLLPQMPETAATGAAIHAALAAGVAADFASGATRFVAREATSYQPNPTRVLCYEGIDRCYRALSGNAEIHQLMQGFA